MTFLEKFRRAAEQNRSLVCVGLDPNLASMPDIDVLKFNRAIIDATADMVCGYKLNFAFYETLGVEGLAVLRDTVAYIPDNIPIIGDAKRGDIGNTARAYARTIFEVFNFDATTVNPYMGYDSVEPFLQYTERQTFILCRTSNPGAIDFQSLTCSSEVYGGGRQLFEIVAEKAKEWNSHGNVGLVVGATYPDELKLIRGICPDMLMLVPGIGAQGGDLEAAVRWGAGGGKRKAFFNSSRNILYASSGADFALAARQSADELRGKIESLSSRY